MMVLHHPILLESPQIIDSLAFALRKVAWHFSRSGMPTTSTQEH
jgi:hypothetical protein